MLPQYYVTRNAYPIRTRPRALYKSYHYYYKDHKKFNNVSVTAAAALSRDAYATSNLSAEACTQRLAAERGDGHPIAAAAAAAIAWSPVHIERPSTGRQV